MTIIVITIRMGSVAAWWPKEWPAHWQNMSWGFDPSQRVSFGVLVLSTTLWYVCTSGSDQMSIQRFLSTRDAAAARMTMGIAQATDVLVSILLAFTGLAILGYYQLHQSELPVGLNAAQGGDKLFPLFIMNQMPAGLSGLVLAAILSAALSSLSSGVNSSCAVLEKDFVSRRTKVETTETATAAIARLKWLTWLVAGIAIALSLLNTLIEGNLVERCYKIVNLLTAPLFVLFFLALFVRWANAPGAWLGLLSSTATAILIAYANDLGLKLGIGFVWMVPCSLLVGIVVGTVGSALFQPWVRRPS